MNSETNIESKVGRPAANKVGGMRVPAPDHPVPVVRKVHEKKDDEDSGVLNADQQELEKLERFEYEKQTRKAAGERLARMYERQPKHEITNNFRQNQNIYVDQPVLHNHEKSGGAVQQ